MGGTAQGNADMSNSAAAFAHAIFAQRQQQRERALQDAQVAEKTGDLSAAEAAYGRAGIPMHFPSITVPGMDATNPEPVQGQQTPSGEGGTEGGPGRGAPAYTPGQPAIAPVTMKYDPSQGLTFAQLVAGDRELSSDPDVRRMLPAFGNRPAHEVMALDQSLRRTAIDPITGMQTTVGGLFPNVGQKLTMKGNISSRANEYSRQLHEAFTTGDTALGDQVAAQAAQFRALATQKDPSLAALIPDYTAMWQAQRGQISHAQARINVGQADRDVALARQQLLDAQKTGDKATILAAHQRLQAAIAQGKPVWQQAGVAPELAGSQTPEQETAADMARMQGSRIGNPVTVTGRDGTYTYVQYARDNKPFFKVYDQKGNFLYEDTRMPGENSLPPTVNVNVTAPTQNAGTPVTVGNHTYQERINPRTGKTEWTDEAGHVYPTLPTHEPGTTNHAAPDVSNYSSEQLGMAIMIGENPGASKAQIDLAAAARKRLTQEGMTLDAKGNVVQSQANTKPTTPQGPPKGAPTGGKWGTGKVGGKLVRLYQGPDNKFYDENGKPVQ